MAKRWLDNKTIIITGASSGFGRLLATSLIQKHGCLVLGIGRSAEKFAAFKEELGSFSGRLIPHCFDVGDRAAWAAFRETLVREGITPDCLINCAGIMPPFNAALDTPIETFEKTMQTNFYAALYGIEALKDLLAKSSEGAIVNIDSSSALATIVGTAPYTASKAALYHYTQCLQYELGKKRYVGLIMPGFSPTAIMRDIKLNEKEERMIRRFSTPEDKMAKKILRAIIHKRKRCIPGADAKLMYHGYRLFPRTTMKAIRYALRKSGLPMFENVFESCDHKNQGDER